MATGAKQAFGTLAIGVEINFDAAAKHPFEEVRPIQWYHYDGSDW